ncbi:Crp/Fnr family transcriptional regulator [Ruminococcus sp.]|uniref:Crp/Fnr family transcriptional regulator n=1 Tax=Ruminococcus sp. TaxID=41978 RepID=UPI0025FE52DB|nr:Crp/Fnr family transcriptional regulator [Ruminococcus sp.]MBQ8966566.1 Crp/Fnr family transcriptional regulator [Ruminococcus sp.]
MDKKYFTDQLSAFAEKLGLTVSGEILDKAVSLASFRVVSKGSLLSAIGDDTSQTALVLSGIARCYYISEDGSDMTRGFAPEGYMCMDEGLFGYRERICMWETLEETTLMFCKTAELKALIDGSAEFKDIWIILLENAMRYKIYRENSFLTENSAERYIRFRKMFPELSGRVPQKHIATYLGIAPESLSRIRSAMKEEQENEQ